MKIFKLILMGALGFSGYIGYQNFSTDLTIVDSSAQEKVAERKITKPRISESKSQPQKQEPLKREIDFGDMGLKVLKTVAPLIVPIIAARRRKTLDEEIGDVAVAMGVSKRVIRGKLGLGDRRKKQVGKRKRRVSD